MNQLSTERRAAVIRALVEGNSIRATVRMTGVAKNTVTKLLVDLGAECWAYQADNLKDLPCTRIECDEIWAFCGMKEKNVPADHRTDGASDDGYGDTWTWTAICADSKLVPCWHVGKRTPDDAQAFIADLASRLSNRVQLSTDGLKMYLTAVDKSFTGGIDYGMIIKRYGIDPAEGAKRYSPAKCTSVDKKSVKGSPDEALISTSYVERQNLTMRMSMRRFTRLTNGFSKKLFNMMCAVALHFMWYNFGRSHQTLTKRAGCPTTPAMAAGVADHIWTVEEIIGLLDKQAGEAP